jgi:hypothetical protein
MLLDRLHGRRAGPNGAADLRSGVDEPKDDRQLVPSAPASDPQLLASAVIAASSLWPRGNELKRVKDRRILAQRLRLGEPN